MGPRCSLYRRVRDPRGARLVLLGTSVMRCGGRCGAARAGRQPGVRRWGRGVPEGSPARFGAGRAGPGLLSTSLRPSLRESCGVWAQRRPASPLSCCREAWGLPWQPCWPARAVLAPALCEGPRGKTVWERKAGFPRRECKKVLSALQRLSGVRVWAWRTAGPVPALFWPELGACLSFCPFPKPQKKIDFI